MNATNWKQTACPHATRKNKYAQNCMYQNRAIVRAETNGTTSMRNMPEPNLHLPRLLSASLRVSKVCKSFLSISSSKGCSLRCLLYVGAALAGIHMCSITREENGGLVATTGCGVGNGPLTTSKTLLPAFAISPIISSKLLQALTLTILSPS